MTPNELINYLRYANNSLNLTIISTEEYERLRKIETLAKKYFNDERAKKIKSLLTEG